MPRYTITATGRGEQPFTTTKEAENLPALCSEMAREGLTVVRADQDRVRTPRIRGIPFLEVIAIYRQIASSLEAGMPLYETLDMLSTESRSAPLKSLLFFIRSQIGDGVPLWEAMLAFPNIFAPVHVAVIRAGEESGSLAQSLDNLADQAEALSNMSRRFASSLVYPTVIALTALFILNFSLVGIVPRFKGLFVDLGITEFPIVTRAVFWASNFLFPATLALLLGAALLVILIVTQRRAASGRLWLDSWKLRIPVLGQIVEKAALARFSGTLGLLLDAGVDLPRAVRLAAEGAGNGTVERLLKNVSAQVELGETLSESIAGGSTMPATLAWRIGVGEETGTLSDALIRMGRLYSGQVDSLVTSLAGFLEPVLIIVVGTGIAALVMGMFLPLVTVINGLTGGSEM